MDSGEGGSDQELEDLAGGEGALDALVDAVSKGRDSVVGVL